MKEVDAVVAQYGRLKKVLDRICGGEMCVFRSVHVDQSVDVVAVLYGEPAEMPSVLVVVGLVVRAVRTTAWLLE